MSNVFIQTATLEEAPALARLLTQLGYATTSDEMRERLQSILAHPDYHTLVAASMDTIVGMAGMCVGYCYEQHGVYGRLNALVVDEHWRGQGIGGQLVAQAEHWLRERGAGMIIINSGIHRQAAHAFYQRLGYAITGLRLVKTVQ